MTNTVNGMKPAIGQLIAVSFESLTFACKVIDVKVSWGKHRLLIEPRAGAGIGRQWIELSRVESILESNPYTPEDRQHMQELKQALSGYEKESMQETAKQHQEADSACGRDWNGPSGCYCGACRIVRQEVKA